MQQQIRELFTTQIENSITDRDGQIVKRQFIQYGSPTSFIMSRAIAESLQMIKKSWRIVTNDGKPDKQGKVNIVEHWHREGWEPDEEKTGE